MLDSEENPGLFTFLVGMIVLVMVAVGFSLVLDKRFKFSSGVEDLRKEVETQTADLKELTVRRDVLSETLARSSTDLMNCSKEHADVTRKLDAFRKQQVTLLEKRTSLESAIATLDQRFSTYRANYRDRTWSRAIGENLGDLTIRGGREYKDSRISKVTDVGLEIRHEHGIARIQPLDLSQAIQDRFQWNDEERRQRLKEKEARLHGKTPSAVVNRDDESGDPTKENDPDGALQPVLTRQEKADREAAERAEKRAEREMEREMKREKVNDLRQQVKGWRSKVSQLSDDQQRATHNASFGNSASVPGSLETWKEKSARLGRDLTKARMELELAKGRLSTVSPSDPELKRDQQR